ncbi:MAG: tetratricopeptide repeat protein [Myxococcota bacterium]
MIPLVVALFCAAQEPAELDYRGSLDQARFQIRKGYWDQALADLEKAVTHPDGRNDAEAWFLLAQVRLQVGDVMGARKAANHALTNARTPDQQSQTTSLVMLLESAYGIVTLGGSQPGLTLRPKFVPSAPLVDPEQSALVERTQKRLRSTKPLLPVTVSLPIGDWSLNGQNVTVDALAPSRVLLTPRQASGGLAAARLAWLEVGVGVTTHLGREAHLLPSPDTMLALTVPVGGPWAVGLVSHWSIAMMQTESGAYAADPRTAQIGARFGPLLDDGEVVLVRPAIGYRFGGISGLRLTCEGESEAFVCGDRPADLVVYANGTAHVIFAELAADYLDRRRSSGMGAGLRVILEQSFASLKDSGKTRGESVVPYSVQPDAQHPGRTALRVLVHVSLAF